jgi:hypothetical protein
VTADEPFDSGGCWKPRGVPFFHGPMAERSNDPVNVAVRSDLDLSKGVLLRPAFVIENP